MIEKAPLNMTIIEPQEYIQRKNCLPVTNHSIYEASTSRFHPDGLFSEVIFGQIGSNERLIRRGYIDLRTTAISPHIYRQLITLKSFYKEVIAGKAYAYYDPVLKDLVKTDSEDPNGETGYSYFLSMIPKIKFSETSSTKRHDKIELIKKYADRMFIKQMIVLPAGVRDVREENGRISPEEINKYYLGLMSLTQALPDNDSEDPVFDAIRYQIQMKIQQIYEYIANLISGKGGYGQSKYAARATVYGNRNVISAYPISRMESSTSPALFKSDEVIIPLFQAMKAAVPLMVNKLSSIFFNTVFNGQNQTVPLINEKYELTYVEVDNTEFSKYTSSEGMEAIINSMRNEHILFDPVTVKGIDKKNYYMYLVYDHGDEIYTFRNLQDFLSFQNSSDKWSTEKIHYLDQIPEESKPHVVIAGSSACVAYGVSTDNEDLDIFKRSPDVNLIEDRNIEVITHTTLKDFNVSNFDEFTNKCCNRIDGYWILKPEYLLQMYNRTNRIKDRKKIKGLEKLNFDKSKLRPLTNIEMCYIALYLAVGRDGVCTAARYPILNLQGIVPFKPHPISTLPGRTVTWKNFNESAAGIVLPEYPVIHGKIKTSMSIHPSTLPQYAGDHDGV